MGVLIYADFKLSLTALLPGEAEGKEEGIDLLVTVGLGLLVTDAIGVGDEDEFGLITLADGRGELPEELLPGSVFTGLVVTQPVNKNNKT